MSEMFQIRREYSFDAAHQLVHLPESHKCSRLHGHTYYVHVTVGSPGYTQPGMVLDFADLDSVIKNVIEVMDHRFLSSGDEPVLDVLPEQDVVDLGVPTTAENLSEYIGNQIIPSLELMLISLTSLRVDVYETPKSRASWVWLEEKGEIRDVSSRF